MIPVVQPDTPLKHDAETHQGAGPADTVAGPGADDVAPAGAGNADAQASPETDTKPAGAVTAAEAKGPAAVPTGAKAAEATGADAAVAAQDAAAPGTKTEQAAPGTKPAEAASSTETKPAEEVPEVGAKAADAVVRGKGLNRRSIAEPGPVSAAAVTGLPPVAPAGGAVSTLPAEAAAKVPRTPKAGRDLPAAIGVGLTLLVLVIGTLLFYPVGFVGLATIFVGVGVWEVSRAIAGKGIATPLTPVMVGALAMPACAYFAGPEGLLFALVASVAATVLWRSLDSEPGAVKSILAGVFALMWIPFLLSFVFLMLRGEEGPTTGLTLDLGNISPGVLEVIIMLLLVVANDTFGYLVGVLFGKHPMAPKISPKKSWEGFAGSLAGAAAVGILATVFILEQPWWVGLALAVGMVFAGTGGDFAESMVKRELGVKDMSNLLPGHGGVMDRLDSILFAAPVAYAIFTVLGRF
ncbi:phosphatidate cytidylyltransferase [Arthrobacter stackebrandtii]|nr:phosphatidate cytidylyltransferase [Arthrobacter stackebrandtii]